MPKRIKKRREGWHKWFFGGLAALMLSVTAGGLTDPAIAVGSTGWNAVVVLKADGQIVQMLRYNPEHKDSPEKVFPSEASCKTVIENDEKFQADIKELRETIAKAPDAEKLEIQVGCMEIDAEPETF